MSEETFRWVVAGGVAIATLSMFTMAVVTVVLLRVIGRLQDRVNGVADKTEPVIDSVRYLINENAAKVNVMLTAAKETAVHGREIAVQAREVAVRANEIAVNARDLSVVAKDQAVHFAALGRDFAEVGRDMANVGRDVADRARERVAQVDSAVDDTVVQIQNLGENVRSGVMRPIHEVSGVLAGIRAGVAAFASGQRPSVARATQDEEMFI